MTYEYAALSDRAMSGIIGRYKWGRKAAVALIVLAQNISKQNITLEQTISSIFSITSTPTVLQKNGKQDTGSSRFAVWLWGFPTPKASSKYGCGFSLEMITTGVLILRKIQHVYDSMHHNKKSSPYTVMLETKVHTCSSSRSRMFFSCLSRFSVFCSMFFSMRSFNKRR